MYRKILRRFVFSILGARPRISRRLGKIKENELVTILNLHRVSSNDKSAYEPLNPRVFEQLLIFLKANYKLTSFSDLEEDARRKLDKPLAIISFDDGYKDFIDVACPILKKLEIKVNHNIIPECVMTGVPPFNVAVQDFIGKASPLELKKLSVPGFELGNNLSNRISIGGRLSNYIKNKPVEEQNYYRGLILPQIKDLPSFQPVKMMNLQDLRQIIAVHEIGAHSFSHANMGVESDDFVKTDLSRCKEWFRKNVGIDVTIYAFPNGSHKTHHFQFALDHGYKFILLVNDTFSRPTGAIYDRFNFHAESLGEARFRTAGKFVKID